jgi:hypothetical protein
MLQLQRKSKSKSRILFGLAVSAAAGFGVATAPALVARAQNKPAAAPAAPAAKPTCKLHGKNCCDPAIAAHLPVSAVYSACGESEATFAGEEGSKDTCKYVFKIAGEKEDETYVQVYAPTQKQVLEAPNDPFFGYKKVGKVYMTDKAKSPKSAPMLASQTGLYLPGKGYSVSVNASIKVCTKNEAKKLAASMK